MNHLITLEENELIALVEKIVIRIEEKRTTPSKWMTPQEVQKLLNISKGSLQKLRDQSLIVFSKLSHKIILYDRNSVEAYIQKYVQKNF